MKLKKHIQISVTPSPNTSSLCPPTSNTSVLAAPKLLVIIKHTIPLFTTPQIRMPMEVVKFFFSSEE